MEFCTSPAQRSKKQKDVVPDSCYRRLKGILFFNRHTPVSNNKLKILLDERKDLSSALEDASTERRLPQEFRSWLEKCHRELDKEVGPKLVTQLCIFCWGFFFFYIVVIVFRMLSQWCNKTYSMQKPRGNEASQLTLVLRSAHSMWHVAAAVFLDCVKWPSLRKIYSAAKTFGPRNIT